MAVARLGGDQGIYAFDDENAWAVNSRVFLKREKTGGVLCVLCMNG
jgi:hypothetical protein